MFNIKQVPSWKCSDGVKVDTKEEALKHEQFLEIRSIFNRNTTSNSNMITASEACRLIVDNIEEISTIRSRYARSLSQLRKKK